MVQQTLVNYNYKNKLIGTNVPSVNSEIKRSVIFEAIKRLPAEKQYSETRRLIFKTNFSAKLTKNSDPECQT